MEFETLRKHWATLEWPAKISISIDRCQVRDTVLWLSGADQRCNTCTHFSHSTHTYTHTHIHTYTHTHIHTYTHTHTQPTHKFPRMYSMRAKHPSLFTDPSLLYYVLSVMGMYRFRLTARRFLLELFTARPCPGNVALLDALDPALFA